MKIDAKKIILTLIGIFLIGVGVSFNNCAGLGNDPIGIVYDGVRNVAKLTGEQLGTASNFVNWGIIILLLFIGRRYINIGTLIYILPYGFFVNLGAKIYNNFLSTDIAILNWLTVAVGCLLLYTGVAIFIFMDIGLDPFSGLVMVIRDKLGWDYKRTKIMFDIIMIIIGLSLGGKLGVVTVLTALTAGPGIQFISNRFKKMFG